MSRHALMISAALVGLLAAAPAMSKSQPSLYQLPLVSGSSETLAFGVTDDLTITGFWLDSSGIENGFVGPADGSNYTTFNDDSTGGTQPRGISKKGYVTGIDDVESGNPLDYIPYERSPDGTITDVTMNGTTLNYLVQGINKKDIFTGSYENSSGDIIGYTGKNAEYSDSIDLTGITNTGVAGRGIDDAGDIVGWYLNSSGVEHGFYLPSGGTAVTIDDPNGITNPEGSNNKGEISGIYTDTSGNRHGFIYEISTQEFTELTIPGSSYVEVWGLNDKGVVAIDGENSSGVFVGYLYCPKTKDCPSAATRTPQVPVLHRPMHVPQQIP